MRPKLTYLSLGLSGLFLGACSPSGAAAQSAVNERPQQVEQNIQSGWSVDKSASSLSFSGSMNGDAFSGSFAKFDAWIQLDPANLSGARIKVSVEIMSVDAGDSELTEALPGKEWFAAKTFPNALFESSAISKTSSNQYEANGALTIKGVTRPLILPFTLEIEDGVGNATAQLVINRTDFGIGSGMWKDENWVVHQVIVDIAIIAKRK